MGINWIEEAFKYTVGTERYSKGKIKAGLRRMMKLGGETSIQAAFWIGELGKVD